MSTYAYIHVFKGEQEEQQRLIMENIGFDPSRIFIDKQVSKKYANPVFRKLIGKLEHGDALYINSLNMLGKNYEDILKQWLVLTNGKGVDIVVLDTPLLNTRLHKEQVGSLVGDLTSQILGFVVKNEAVKRKRPQAAGIAAARAKGVHMGRPSAVVPDNLDFEELVRCYESKDLSLDEVVSICKFSRATFFRRLKDYRRKR